VININKTTKPPHVLYFSNICKNNRYFTNEV